MAAYTYMTNYLDFKCIFACCQILMIAFSLRLDNDANIAFSAESADTCQSDIVDSRLNDLLFRHKEHVIFVFCQRFRP